MKSKRCPCCERTLSLSDFNLDRTRHDGLQVYCRDCQREHYQAYYQANKERCNARSRSWERNNPKRKAESARRSHAKNPLHRPANHKVNHAIRDGRLKRGACEVCGTTENIDGHHPDYSKPLEVSWLCKKHHRAAHKDQKPCDTPNCHEWIDADGPDTCGHCNEIDMEGKKEMADEQD